jgi:hypothetical protein
LVRTLEFLAFSGGKRPGVSPSPLSLLAASRRGLPLLTKEREKGSFNYLLV